MPKGAKSKSSPRASSTVPSSPAAQLSSRQERLSRPEIDRILKGGYPEDNILDQFPLGDILKQIPHVNDRYGRQPNGDEGHIRRVVQGVNILLGDHPEQIAPKLDEPQYQGPVPSHVEI